MFLHPKRATNLRLQSCDSLGCAAAAWWTQLEKHCIDFRQLLMTSDIIVSYSIYSFEILFRNFNPITQCWVQSGLLCCKFSYSHLNRFYENHSQLKQWAQLNIIRVNKFSVYIYFFQKTVCVCVHVHTCFLWLNKSYKHNWLKLNSSQWR